jgi:hypothetical protein
MESHLSGFRIVSSHPDLSGLIPIILLNFFRKSDFVTNFEKRPNLLIKSTHQGVCLREDKSGVQRGFDQ